MAQFKKPCIITFRPFRPWIQYSVMPVQFHKIIIMLTKVKVETKNVTNHD